MFSDMKDKMKGAANKAKESASSLKDGAGDMFNKVVDSSMTEIQALRPILAQSGFIIGDIVIEVALSPKVTLIIEQVEESKIPINEAFQQEGLSKIQSTILNSISKVHGLNSVIEKYEHIIGQIEIELGLPPTVKAHLNSVKSRAFSTVSKVTEGEVAIEAK